MTSTLPKYGGYDFDREPNVTGEGLASDAWGRQKVVLPQTQLHGMFTYSVPLDKWKESVNGVEELGSYTNANSVNGKLRLDSNGVLNDVVVLDTFRNPRYQPDRGSLYGNSVFLPDPTANGIRDFGTFTEESGIFFRLKSDGLYACLQTKLNGVIQTVREEPIDQSSLPYNYDPEKGNIYDMQMQWRGVGNIGFYIGEESSGFSTLVHVMKNLNISTELNIWNPANPLAFRCINLGDDVAIECGCVNQDTEGGEKSTGSYGSVSINNDTGQLALTGFNVPVIAVRSKRIVGSDRNTRDVLALLATAYSSEKSFFRVWVTRDDTAIILNDQVWTDFRDGHLHYIINGLNGDGTPLVGDAFEIDLTKLGDPVFGTRVDQDNAYATSALFEGRSDIYQTPGDIFIFTLHRENGILFNGGVTYEFAEEI